MPRFFCPTPLVDGLQFELPAGAARHVQVLRLQPGTVITLFNGEGGEWSATVLRMGRSDVEVTVGAHVATEREPVRRIHLAVGMPANERMDWLVEKATELGVASIQPLHTAHGVLRLAADRALKKQLHWQAIAESACEQCGRNRVPVIHAVADLSSWTRKLASEADVGRYVLSLREAASTLASLQEAGETDGPGEAVDQPRSMLFLSGPEGGLSPAEEDAAIGSGFVPLSLGPRVLRAETAAIAVVAVLAALA